MVRAEQLNNRTAGTDTNTPTVQGISQLLKQSDWAQIQDFK